MIQENIKKIIENSIKKIGKRDFLSNLKITIDIPKESTHGDFSVNVALVLAKMAKEDPMDIANSLVEAAREIKGIEIERIEALAPGFINFFLSEKFLEQEINLILKKGSSYGSSQVGKGKTMVIDYSAPNIAKSFGIGHLRSTIIGQAIYNIYSFLGWNCVGVNHLGDWGTQFGKLIYQIKNQVLMGSSDPDKSLNDLTISELESLYVGFHKEAEISPKLEDRAREEFKKLESGDLEATKIWKACVDISIREFNRIYDLLGVKIEHSIGESFYVEMTKEIVKELKDKNILKESQGALVVEFPNEEFPSLVAIKSDRTSTYIVRDLATIRYRIDKWKPDLIAYEVGVDQSLHFKQLFKIVDMLGWEQKETFVHISHGLVRWPHGKFSTRRGDTVHLEDILEESIERSLKIIESVEDFSAEEKEEISRFVGVGAVKYNDLSQHHSKDILFDWEKILNLKGNSGPYLQYTFARCKGVLRKLEEESLVKDISLVDINEDEKNILRLIRLFPMIVEEAGKEFSPNIICNFLFDLSQKYNLFYNRHPIIKAQGDEKKKLRIVITTAVAQVINNGLNLLGIEAPEKM
ncbi:MAG: arginine--tRNA ligase [Candidatus Nealsonbacteria bacterium]|nr:arginine--tRNA ligase [Candidatus Nealsonbacteria bacterium]